MPDSTMPGVYIEEPKSVSPILGRATDVTGFVGLTERGPYSARVVSSIEEFEAIFGADGAPERGFLPCAVRGFFENGGRKAYIARVGRGKNAPVKGSEFTGNIRAKGAGPRGLAALSDLSRTVAD